MSAVRRRYYSEGSGAQRRPTRRVVLRAVCASRLACICHQGNQPPKRFSIPHHGNIPLTVVVRKPSQCRVELVGRWVRHPRRSYRPHYDNVYPFDHDNTNGTDARQNASPHHHRQPKHLIFWCRTSTIHTRHATGLVLLVAVKRATGLVSSCYSSTVYLSLVRCLSNR